MVSRRLDDETLSAHPRGMVEVKICGLTTVDDAVRCIEAGADAIGLNFWPARPGAWIATAREIVEAVGDRAAMVGVFVDFTLDQVREILQETGIPWAQLHGDEPPELGRRAAADGLQGDRGEGRLRDRARPTLSRRASLARCQRPGDARRHRPYLRLGHRRDGRKGAEADPGRRPQPRQRRRRRRKP